MLTFSSSIFPNMSTEWSFEEPQNYEITNDLFEGLHIDNNIQYSPSSLMEKKQSHNASERNRRKKMNFVYSTLRSLLPPAILQKKKRLSFPATVCYVQEYIPELKKKIETLSQTKDMLLSKKADSLVCQPNNKRNTTSSTSSISASSLCNGQVLVQISTTQTNGFPISQVFQTLEEDGFLLLNATSFKSFGDNIFHNLHFQMQGTIGIEIQSLKTKLLVMYEENQNRSLA